jgi:hypothetical protein
VHRSVSPISQGDWAVYIEGPRDGRLRRAYHQWSVRELAGAAAGPRASAFRPDRQQHDPRQGGNESFFAGSASAEPNDTIFNAIDTRQGRAGSPEVYTASGRIGDNPYLQQMPTADVDMYKFQLDVGDQVLVVTSNEFVPELRLFDSVGRDFEAEHRRRTDRFAADHRQRQHRPASILCRAGRDLLRIGQRYGPYGLQPAEYGEPLAGQRQRRTTPSS